jgi:hypothetical protein
MNIRSFVPIEFSCWSLVEPEPTNKVLSLSSLCQAGRKEGRREEFYPRPVFQL